MTLENKVLGLSFSEINELKARADALNVTDLIREIAALRAKVSFYESRVEQMALFRSNTEGRS